MADVLGVQDYREGAMLRLDEARALYESEHWVGCIYLAGRAVEGILRALLWARGRQHEVGHDLRDLLKRSDAAKETTIQNAVNEIAVVWRNDLRYTGSARMARLLRGSNRHARIGSQRVTGDPLKANAKSALEASETIVARGSRYAASRGA